MRPVILETTILRRTILCPRPRPYSCPLQLSRPAAYHLQLHHFRRLSSRSTDPPPEDPVQNAVKHLPAAQPSPSSGPSVPGEHPSASKPDSPHHDIPKQPHPRSSRLTSSPLLALIQARLRATRSKLSNELEQLPTRLSQLTGYRDIDNLKALVAQKEADLRASRETAHQMKTLYNQASQRRAESVREVNDLLGRKASWSDTDLARFTTLVRTDHSNEQAESEAKRSLDAAEARVDTEFTAMMQAILSRYHEEQVWSDKIRSLSTTFSLSITLINVLVFLGAIVLVEPYKRAKVVAGVESRMIARDASHSDLLDRALSEVVARLSASEKQLSELVQALRPPPPVEPDHLEPPPSFEQTLLPQPVEKQLEALDSSLGEPEADLAEDHDRRDDPIESFAPEPTLMSKIWQRWPTPAWAQDEQEKELVKVLGLSAAVGVVVIGLFQLFSK